MKATSVQNIKNVNDISFTIENYPFELKSKLIIVAGTNDDIFAFEFEGDDLLQQCKAAGLFSGWEKDQKIRELEKELSDWKRKADECENKIKEKNRKINELNQQLHQANREKERLTDRSLIEKQLIKELEKGKEKPQSEEPSSRSDILGCAEKCVCGQREQDYGTPESNFQLIADLWNQYLFKEPGAKEVFGIGPMDVSMMMALLKIARIRNGGGSGDSFVDLAGYAACGGEIWAGEKKN